MPWKADHARAVILREGADPAALLVQADHLLQPVPGKWLADRLRALWSSTTPSSAMTADSWLRETGRALKDLPFHIAQHAIDGAFRGAVRGFTPAAGEILAIATPLVEELRRQRAMLDEVANPRPAPSKAERYIAPEDLCSPEAARAILHKFGFRSILDADEVAPETISQEPHPKDGAVSA